MQSVSVVIPVKDDADQLRTCLAALAAQTVRPREIIVVDNGSSDESAEIAWDAGARVITERTPGIAAAASTGYDSASGDIIGRLDADSLPGPTWVADLARAFQREQDAAAVTGGAYFTDGPRAFRRIAVPLYLGAYFSLVGLALGHPPIFGSN